MKKSIYSLVLADDVVAAVDRMAYELHTSRSNLINQLLAERLSCTTPEMRMQSVFSAMDALTEQFRVLEQTSAHLLSLQSRLDYKYKPTVQYFVELYRVPEDGAAGKLRVQLRTQNASLLAVLDSFFRLWTEWESAFAQVTCRITPGRLERTIRDTGLPEETLGRCISSYVRQFDSYLKAWFAGISSPQETAQQLGSAFAAQAQKTGIAI